MHMRGTDRARRAAVTVAAGLVIAAAAPAPADATTDGIGVDGPFDAALGTGFDGAVTTIVPLADGDLLVGGDFRRLDGGPDAQGLVRLRPDGTPDAGCTARLGTGLSGSVSTAVQLPDGDLLVGGRFGTLAGTDVPDNLVRLEDDGTVDTGFSATLGAGLDGEVTAVLALQDGDLLVVGAFDTLDGSRVPHGVVRLEPDGSVDTAFAAALGSGFGNRVSTALELPGGDLLIAGSPAAGRPYYLARLHADGSPDTGFNAVLGSGFNGSVDALTPAPGGDVLVGGSFNTLNGSSQVPRGLVRLRPDGSRDTGFEAALGGGFAGAVRAIATLPGGDFMVAGSFSSFDGDPAIPANLLRLHGDGGLVVEVDGALGTGLDADGLALAALPGGEVLVGGEFRGLNGATSVADGLLRLGPASVTVTPVPDRTDPVGAAVDLPVTATTSATATGWPLVLAAAGLPDGLTFDPASGRVTGSPTTPGRYPVRFSATLHPVTAPLADATTTTWTVTAPPTLAGAPPDGTVAVGYRYAFALGGDPAPTVAVTGGALPPGLALDPRTGELTGVPTRAGSYPAELTASNGTPPDAVLPVTIRVVAGGAAPTPAPSATGGVGATDGPDRTTSADARTGASGIPTRLLALTGPSLVLAGAGTVVLLGTGTALLRARRRGRLH